MTTKKCTRCKVVKPLTEFNKGQYGCRPCVKEKRMGGNCEDCGKTITTGMTRCKPCNGVFYRGENNPQYKTGRWVNNKGYVILSGQYGHPNAFNRSALLLEHVKVMSEVLGRPLFKGENVHHKNGVTGDNRPENLELWVTSQPKGQRPEDLVLWAREILARYA